MDKIRWGMLGTGMIAKSFTKDFKFVQGGRLEAVAGRDFEKSKVFAKEFDIPNCFSETRELLESNNIDAVYIATPHPSHFELAMQCLENEKHILVEKPITMNAKQANSIFKLAEEKNLFVCEAMWTRFLPFTPKLAEAIKEEKIGALQTVQSSMGYPFLNQKPERLFQKELGGGSLLDMGVYSLAFSNLFTRNETYSLASNLVVGTTGVDQKASWILTYENGVQCIGSSSIESKLNHEATISGSKGQIRVPEFWRANGFYIDDEYIACKYEGVGLHHQVTAANSAIRNGQNETLEMPWRDSIETMTLVDKIFDQHQK